MTSVRPAGASPAIHRTSPVEYDFSMERSCNAAFPAAVSESRIEASVDCMLATCFTNQLSSSSMISKTHFDAAYYRRYYENRETAVVDAGMMRNEVRFVAAFCNHIGQEV